MMTLKVTAANGVPFTVVYEPEGRLVTFYDSRHMQTEHGQKVSQYRVGDILSVTGGLNLYGGEPDWTVDADTMVTIVGWLRGVDLPLVTSTERLKIGDRIMVKSDGGNDNEMTVWRTYHDQSIGRANSFTVMAHIRPGGYGVSLHNDNLGRYNVRLLKGGE
jgi:hypothetical protein